MPRQREIFKVVPGPKAKPHYFQNKGAAKKVRDLSTGYGGLCVVMRGPDHWRGESFNTTKRTRGARSTWV